MSKSDKLNNQGAVASRSRSAQKVLDIERRFIDDLFQAQDQPPPHPVILELNVSSTFTTSNSPAGVFCKASSRSVQIRPALPAYQLDYSHLTQAIRHLLGQLPRNAHRFRKIPRTTPVLVEQTPANPMTGQTAAALRPLRGGVLQYPILAYATFASLRTASPLPLLSAPLPARDWDSIVAAGYRRFPKTCPPTALS